MTVLWSNTTSTTAQTTIDLDRVQRATVFIMQTETIAGRSIIRCVGTGTIVDRTGFIATNAHLTVPNRTCPGTNLVIALSIAPDEPPIPIYRAEVAQANAGLDLALLRITQELNGRIVENNSLTLPFVPLGDSSSIGLDETVTVVGFPELGTQPVTSVRGTVTGFVAEPAGGTQSWIKTDTTIQGTMTGGGVYNQAGQLIAIPSTIPITSIAPGSTSCVAIEDTNNDGLINNNDLCVPTGGFINALRPINFVRPLLRGATLDLTVEKVTGANFQLTGGGEPSFSRLIVSPSVTEGMPTTIVSNLPVGTNRLFLFFDYHNMTPETIYDLRVAIDGSPSAVFSLAPVRWSGGTNGLWYIGIGSTEQVLPNGTYEFILSINGTFAESTTIIVGSRDTETPLFRNIFFCIEAGENCFGDVYLLPRGNVVSARFIHQNVPEGTPWTARWLYNDAEIPESRIDDVWITEPRDTKTIRLEAIDGLPAGRYRLELYLNGRLSATADFTIAGASEGAFSRIFSDVRLTSAQSPEEAIENAAISSFPNTTRDIYAVFNWEQLAPGTLWSMRWYVDNSLFFSETVPWNVIETGQNFVVRLTSPDGIPDGSYRMELAVNDVLRENNIVEAEVGIGQLAIDVLAQTGGLQLNGRIIDADTGEGIPGVSFILISEDYSIADFEWDQEQVYAITVTDRNGNFQLDRLLEYDVPYSLVITAEGYAPITQDGIIVNAETDNPLFVQLPLVRD